MAEQVTGAIKSEVNFEKLSREFDLDEKEVKKRLLRTIALLAVFLLILFAINYQDWLAQCSGQLSFLLAIVSTVVLFCFLTKSALSKVKLKISLVNGKLIFPYYYLWLSEIPLERVLSSEDLKANGAIEAVIVGSKGGGLTYFEKGIFSYESQFYELQECLFALARRNSKSGLGENIDVVERNSSHTHIQLVVITVWVAVFLLVSLNISQDLELIIEKGALSRQAILEGEFYRLFSSFFLHSGYVHISTNILVLSALSQSLLRIVDSFRYLNIVFFSSLVAACVTLLVHPYEFVVGASGGVFGIFGAYCAVKFARELPGSVSFLSEITIYLVIAAEVLYGVLNVKVDLYSHVGGFIAGFLIIRLFLATESSQSIYSSTIVERLFSIVLSVLFLSGLVVFFSRIYVEST